MKKKITMYSQQTASIQERFQQFLSASSARGFSAKTIQVYQEHLHCISKHLDISLPLSSLSKENLEEAIASMRASNLSPNSISSYLRALLLEVQGTAQKRGSITPLSIINIPIYDLIPLTMDGRGGFAE